MTVYFLFWWHSSIYCSNAVVWRKYWEYCELKNTVKLKCTYFTLSCCEMLPYNVGGQERTTKEIRWCTVSFLEWSTISTLSHIVPYCYDGQLFSGLVIVEVNRDLCCCNSNSLLQLSSHMLSIQAWYTVVYTKFSFWEKNWIKCKTLTDIQIAIQLLMWHCYSMINQKFIILKS